MKMRSPILLCVFFTCFGKRHDNKTTFIALGHFSHQFYIVPLMPDKSFEDFQTVGFFVRSIIVLYHRKGLWSMQE